MIPDGDRPEVAFKGGWPYVPARTPPSPQASACVWALNEWKRRRGAGGEEEEEEEHRTPTQVWEGTGEVKGGWGGVGRGGLEASEPPAGTPSSGLSRSMALHDHGL